MISRARSAVLLALARLSMQTGTGIGNSSEGGSMRRQASLEHGLFPIGRPHDLGHQALVGQEIPAAGHRCEPGLDTQIEWFAVLTPVNE